MEQTLLGYFFQKLGFYILDFVKTYFIGGHRLLLKTYQNLFTKLEHKVGLIINIRYFLIPLWQEYSLPAYLLSIPYRIIKIIFGGIVLILLTLAFGAVYVCWLCLPFYLIFKTI
ncbi:MAG: hypothetical protein PHF45_00200 [Candidatus Pacebacteria bacterium]|nr:hypothetical protein [Candidatus Paceibacterota bacterium]